MERKQISKSQVVVVAVRLLWLPWDSGDIIKVSSWNDVKPVRRSVNFRHWTMYAVSSLGKKHFRYLPKTRWNSGKYSHTHLLLGRAAGFSGVEGGGLCGFKPYHHRRQQHRRQKDCFLFPHNEELNPFCCCSWSKSGAGKPHSGVNSSGFYRMFNHFPINFHIFSIISRRLDYLQIH